MTIRPSSRDGLEAILSTDDEIEVVGVARHGQEALDLAAQRQPDVVLMDLKMPVLNGVQATERLRKKLAGGPGACADHLRG